MTRLQKAFHGRGWRWGCYGMAQIMFAKNLMQSQVATCEWGWRQPGGSATRRRMGPAFGCPILGLSRMVETSSCLAYLTSPCPCRRGSTRLVQALGTLAPLLVTTDESLQRRQRRQRSPQAVLGPCLQQQSWGVAGGRSAQARCCAGFPDEGQAAK